MKSLANTTLIERLPDGRVRVLDLQLFAGFMTLAARVLYCLYTAHYIARSCTRPRCAPGGSIDAKLGTVSAFDGMPPSIWSRNVSKRLRTREYPMTRAQLAPPSPALFNP